MKLSDIQLTDAQKLQNKLMAEERLPIAYAAILAENALFRFDERVREGVKQYIAGTLTEDFSVEDISLADIRGEVGLEGFAALCFLDVYIKRPEFAEQDVEWFERRYE